MLIFKDAQCDATYLDLLDHMFAFHIEEQNKKERKTSDYRWLVNNLMVQPYLCLRLLTFRRIIDIQMHLGSIKN